MRSLILISCVLALLGGCTSLPSPTIDPSLPARSYQSRIAMSGRLSAQYEANFRQQSLSVHFDWTQSPEQTSISLSSPTGQTVATILITAQGAQLTESGKPPRFASSVDQLTIDVLGWPLPVSGLRDWLQGFLNDQHGELITKATAKNAFDVDGWQMRYVSWQTEENLERPKRLDLSRQTEQAGLVTLRIVVDEWTTP